MLASLGRVGSGAGKGPSAFHFREFAAELVEHRWRFRGRIEPELGARAWSARISMHHLGEDGAEVAPLAITELRVDSEQVAVDLREGTAELEVPLGVLSVIVEGCSAEPIPELEASALGLRVFGLLA